MNLRPIVAAAPEVALRGTVLRLVQQQGINSLEPLVDNLEQLARPYAMDPVSAVVSTGGCSTDRADPPSKDHTTFLCHDDGKLHRFGRELFLIDGGLPGAALLAADAARELAWRGIRSSLAARRHRPSGRPR